MVFREAGFSCSDARGVVAGWSPRARMILNPNPKTLIPHPKPLTSLARALPGRPDGVILNMFIPVEGELLRLNGGLQE